MVRSVLPAQQAVAFSLASVRSCARKRANPKEQAMSDVHKPWVPTDGRQVTWARKRITAGRALPGDVSMVAAYDKPLFEIETDCDLCSVELGERRGWDVTLWNREGGHVVLANVVVAQEAEIMRNRIIEFVASWWPDSFGSAPTAEELVEHDAECAYRDAHPHADVQNADADATTGSMR